MAVIQTKYIYNSTTGFYNNEGYYGSFSLGDVSNSSGGSTNNSTASVHSGSTINALYYSPNTNKLILHFVRTSSYPPNSGWHSITYNGTTFLRSDSSSNIFSGTTRSHVWSGVSSNPASSNAWNVLTFNTQDDETPEGLSFTDVTAASNTERNITDQVTGIDTTIDVTMSGSGSFACVGTSTTPSSSNFSTAAKTITNGQNIHLKVTAGPNPGDTRTITITAGTVTTTWTVTTAAASIQPPTVSSTFTNNNSASPNVIIGVNLSANGSGGTLKYAQTTANSVPASGWQTANGFTHPRGTTRYYWASRDEDTSGTFGSSVSLAVGYIAPDTTITDVDTITRPNGSTDHSITIANGSANTIYEVKTTSASGTVVGSRTGNGNITVANIPSADTSATYYVCGRVLTANGGDNVSVEADTYIVLHEAASGGGSTGGGGTGTYGMRVFDAAGNTTLDVSDRVVIFRERVTGSLSASETSKTVTLSGVGTAVINLTPITNIYVGNNPQRQKILYFTVSGTSLTIQRTATNAPGSANAAQAYDLLVVYDPE